MTETNTLSLEQQAELWRRAEKVRTQAYAPNSKFRVGAFLISAQGHYYAGCNV
ncbi:MAG: hypothetical protein AAGG02_16825 [Cyanobacteria bacterium P01_H01_bin.15]